MLFFEVNTTKIVYVSSNSCGNEMTQNKCVDYKVLKLLANSIIAWRIYDEKHKSFASDPYNVRLGSLASDGFNPSGTLISVMFARKKHI